jgi:hypothetical protein
VGQTAAAAAASAASRFFNPYSVFVPSGLNFGSGSAAAASASAGGFGGFGFGGMGTVLRGGIGPIRTKKVFL